MKVVAAVFWLFVDGMGLGDPDPEVNPLVDRRLRWLPAVAGGRLAAGGWMPAIRHRVRVPGGTVEAAMVALDACLGVGGLPQSATGQAALFTGENAPGLVGRHVNAFPAGPLKDLIMRQSVFRRAAAAGRRVTFVNAFSPEYFALVEAGKLRHSASTLAMLAAGVGLRDLEALRGGEAVYQDITNCLLVERGHRLPLADPEAAGRVASRVASRYDLALFEYFQTDVAGHRGDLEEARRVVRVLDGFVGGLLASGDLAGRLLVIASDHGNVENLKVKTHTGNPVPAIFVGPGAAAVADGLSAITDLAPAILRYLGVDVAAGAHPQDA